MIYNFLSFLVYFFISLVGWHLGRILLVEILAYWIIFLFLSFLLAYAMIFLSRVDTYLNTDLKLL